MTPHFARLAAFAAIAATAAIPSLHSSVASAAPPAFSVPAGWAGGSAPGHTPDSGSLWTQQPGAAATWKPNFGAPLRARVAFYKVVYEKDRDNNDPALRVEVAASGKVTSRSIDETQGTSGWVDLGTFDWAGGPGEYVRAIKSAKRGAGRIVAVRFDVLDESGKTVISTITVDEVTDGPLTMKPPLPMPPWQDIRDADVRRALVSLQAAGIVEGISPAAFAPGRPALRSDMALWLLRAAGRLPAAADATRPPTPDERKRALDAARSAGLRPAAADGPLSARDAADILRAAPAALVPSSRPAPPVPPAYAIPAGGAPLTRGQLAVALARFHAAYFVEGPAGRDRWTLTFHDEFDGESLDRTVWDVESGSPGHIRSSRWPENVQVGDGQLRLLTRREARGGKTWTTGNIWTRAFEQHQGYFECRMRIGAASGLNNAFWLMTRGKSTDAVHFEIDITEAHYPRTSAMTLHNWAGVHTGSGRAYVAPHDLSDDFHVYALRWTEKDLIWYFDGREVRRLDAGFCRRSAPIRLSTAVTPFAGRITDALDGTHMDVDWVRVWAEKDKKDETK